MPPPPTTTTTTTTTAAPPALSEPPTIPESGTVELDASSPCALVSSPGYDDGDDYPNVSTRRRYFYLSQEYQDFTVRYVEEFHVSQVKCVTSRRDF